MWVFCPEPWVPSAIPGVLPLTVLNVPQKPGFPGSFRQNRDIPRLLPLSRALRKVFATDLAFPRLSRILLAQVREAAKNRPRPGRDRDAERERERKVEAGKEKERGKGRERERRRARDGEHARDPDREKSREHDRPEKVGPAWEPPPFAPLCCPPKGPWSSCVTREVAFSVPDSKP